MEVVDLGTVIATRVITGRKDTEQRYLVKLGIPKQMPGFSDYYCPVQIEGAFDDEISYSCGIDAVQAIQLAMKFLGGRLDRLNQESGGNLRWEGDEAGNLGFPLPV